MGHERDVTCQTACAHARPTCRPRGVISIHSTRNGPIENRTDADLPFAAHTGDDDGEREVSWARIPRDAAI